MSQAEDLLNSLSETVIEHKHQVPDSDTYFIIDPYTRQIENTNYKKTVLMRGDHNSERFTFELPRYVDGHDMSLCNRVIVHFDNVGDSIENINSDVAYTDDLRLNPDNPETVICSWLIRREATQIVGILSFSLQYLCVEEDEITYEWNTDSCDDIEVRKSKQNGEAAITKYTNVLEQWRSQLFGSADSVIANITAEGQTQLNNITAEGESRVSAITTEGKTQLDSITAEGQSQVAAVKETSATEQEAIETKGSETLASIPEDYTEVYNMANEAMRTKADGVVLEAEGNAITLTDASDDYLRGLNLYGNTTQVTTTGAQLLDIPDAESKTDRGLTQVIADGVCLVSGTANNTASFNLTLAGAYSSTATLFTLDAGTYTATDCILSTYDGTTRTAYTNTFTLTSPIDITWVSTRSYGATEVVYEVTHPMLNSGGTTLPWEPYTGGVASPNPDYPQDLVSIENPTTYIYGKNLFPIQETSSYGITATPQADGSLLYEGTATGSMWAVYQDCPLHESTTYTITVLTSNKTEKGSIVQLFDKFDAIVNTWHIDKDEYTQTFEGEAGGKVRWSIGVEPGDVVSTSVKLMVNVGDTAMEWEPYVAEQVFAIPHVIPGIPVTSGGNYTDSDGQQWVCDEVDFERGVYIQRCETRSYDGSDIGWTLGERDESTGTVGIFYIGIPNSKNNGAAVCSHFPWGQNANVHSNLFDTYHRQVRFNAVDFNYGVDDWKAQLVKWHQNGTPLTVTVQLSEPIETPLSEAEIKAYKALKTNYPNTTIFNDSGAQMKVKYNADTKIYISKTVEAGVSDAVEDVLNDAY